MPTTLNRELLWEPKAVTMTVFGVRVAVRPVDGVIIVDIVMLPANPSKGQISIAVLLDPPTKKLRKE